MIQMLLFIKNIYKDYSNLYNSLDDENIHNKFLKNIEVDQVIKNK